MGVYGVEKDEAITNSWTARVETQKPWISAFHRLIPDVGECRLHNHTLTEEMGQRDYDVQAIILFLVLFYSVDSSVFSLLSFYVVYISETVGPV